MNARQDVPDDGKLSWKDRSIYNACTVCGSMVCDEDREQHRRWHATLSRAFGQTPGGWGR